VVPIFCVETAIVMVLGAEVADFSIEVLSGWEVLKRR
jgi:hypothetical protein